MKMRTRNGIVTLTFHKTLMGVGSCSLHKRVWENTYYSIYSTVRKK